MHLVGTLEFDGESAFNARCERDVAGNALGLDGLDLAGSAARSQGFDYNFVGRLCGCDKRPGAEESGAESFHFPV